MSDVNPSYPPAPVPPQQPYQPVQPASERWNILAIVGFILTFFVSIAGIILGFIALSQIKRTGEKGHGLALWAVILGFVFIVLGIIFWIVYAVVLTSVINTYQ
jgi:peptidyl-prolyl cis-trans isomerase B (cyclophilin B)